MEDDLDSLLSDLGVAEHDIRLASMAGVPPPRESVAPAVSGSYGAPAGYSYHAPPPQPPAAAAPPEDDWVNGLIDSLSSTAGVPPPAAAAPVAAPYAAPSYAGASSALEPGPTSALGAPYMGARQSALPPGDFYAPPSHTQGGLQTFQDGSRRVTGNEQAVLNRGHVDTFAEPVPFVNPVPRQYDRKDLPDPDAIQVLDPIAWLDDYCNEVVTEINNIRANPAAYAQWLQISRAPYYQGRRFVPPEWKGTSKYLPTEEGRGACDDAISYLRTLPPAGRLMACKEMSMAAEDAVKEAGANGAMQKADSLKRLYQFGAECIGRVAELEGFGVTKPKELVARFICGDGDPTRYERKLLLDETFHFVGLHKGAHNSAFKEMIILNFSEGFTGPSLEKAVTESAPILSGQEQRVADFLTAPPVPAERAPAVDALTEAVLNAHADDLLRALKRGTPKDAADAARAILNDMKPLEAERDRPDLQGAVDRLKDLLKQLLGAGKDAMGDPTKAELLDALTNQFKHKAKDAVLMATDPKYSPPADVVTEAELKRHLDALQHAVKKGSPQDTTEAARALINDTNNIDDNRDGRKDLDDAVRRLKDLLKNLLGCGKEALADPKHETAKLEEVMRDYYDQAKEALRMIHDPRYKPSRQFDEVKALLPSSGMIDAAADAARQLEDLFSGM